MQDRRQWLIGTLEALLEKVVVAFFVWLTFALMPVFRHPVILVLAGPGLGCLFAWFASQDREPGSGQWHRTPGRAVLVGCVHVLLVLLAWRLSESFLPVDPHPANHARAFLPSPFVP